MSDQQRELRTLAQAVALLDEWADAYWTLYGQYRNLGMRYEMLRNRLDELEREECPF